MEGGEGGREGGEGGRELTILFPPLEKCHNEGKATQCPLMTSQHLKEVK